MTKIVKSNKSNQKYDRKWQNNEKTQAMTNQGKLPRFQNVTKNDKMLLNMIKCDEVW